MDGTQFDAWTRRRFGMVTGGTLAGLLGLSLLDDAEAKKHRNNHKNNNKNKKKNKNEKDKCRKLQQSCDITDKNKKCCNKNQLCAQVTHLGSGNHCCKQRGSSCSEDADCCGSDRCGGNDTCQQP